MKFIPVYFVAWVITCLSSPINASETGKGVKLVYQEQEEGVEPYNIIYTVSNDYFRVDGESDSSGYLIFDINKNIIYSVSHFDQSILVITESPSTEHTHDFNIDIEYSALENAPAISGKQVYTYRVNAIVGEKSETCMDIQLVPGLLPEVAKALHSFQKVISGQQLNSLDKTPEEFRTPCYLVDEVFNDGAYYSKGLPIQEWHSNEKRRLLLNFEQVMVDNSIFDMPEEYRRYSLK